MRARLRRCAERSALLVVACLWPGASLAQGTAAPATEQTPLRTFEVARPADPAGPARQAVPLFAAPRIPLAHESLRTMVGVGYVQDADWGTEIAASGGFAGAQVQGMALVTHGSQGFVFDHGAMTIYEPDAQWRVEGGDVFSNLRGAAMGARFSWRAFGNRHPSVAVYAPYGHLDERGTVLAYRDQVVVKGQTLLDAELASDRSYLLRTRVGGSRLDVETTYRVQTQPTRYEEGSLSASVILGRGFGVTGSAFRTFEGEIPSEWNSVAVRIPLGRHADITLERAFAGSDTFSQSSVAAMGSVTAGSVRAFHRHQFGDYAFVGGGYSNTVQRQQTQSMTTFGVGPRLNFTIQLATQRAESGQATHWEELHSTVRLTSSTTVRTVTAIPDLNDPDRFQAFVRQELPGRFALQADYGRLSSYQPTPQAFDRSRLKVMLFKSLDIATPARGAEISGTVRDDAGRGVAGARVKLGPYAADTDPSGAYVFRHVPRGQYELSLDTELLPADFAWDGRGETVTARPGARVTSNLRVTPLNAIHGRVYVDRNSNGRYDQGEGVRAAVVQLGDRLTAADEQGAYSFYNLWPSTYEIRLHTLPSDFAFGAVRQQTLTLSDTGPVTGADFIVLPRTKPIIWESSQR